MSIYRAVCHFLLCCTNYWFYDKSVDVLKELIPFIAGKLFNDCSVALRLVKHSLMKLIYFEQFKSQVSKHEAKVESRLKDLIVRTL